MEGMSNMGNDRMSIRLMKKELNGQVGEVIVKNGIIEDVARSVTVEDGAINLQTDVQAGLPADVSVGVPGKNCMVYRLYEGWMVLGRQTGGK